MIKDEAQTLRAARFPDAVECYREGWALATDPQIQGSGETIHLQQQIARLQALLEASRQVHSTVREEEVLDRVLRIVVRELEMDGAAFPSAALSFGALPEVANQEKSGSKSAMELPAYPLLGREGETMTELVIAPPAGRALTLYEADFIEGLALQAAVALENARNHQRNLEFARLQQDLDAARLIQRSLLPHHLPEIPGYQLAFRSEACYQVGGDYLDVILQADGNLLIAVADVAGKGLASALMSNSFRSAFRAMAASLSPLDEMAARMNRHHWREGEEARRRFVTAIFLRLYPRKGQIEVVNAGHNPGFLLRPGAAPLLLGASGTPLGLFPKMTYTSQRLDFPLGSRLLLYTDGLTEVFAGNEEFGSEQLLESFSACKQQRPDAILDALWVAIAAFSGDSPQGDDMTALALCRAGVAETAP
jgi:serine phosphatase RsbU (regulator of sigma subunit)